MTDVNDILGQLGILGKNISVKRSPKETVVVQSDDLTESGKDFVEHYGVSGMRWGKRRASVSTKVSTEAKRTDQILEKAKIHGKKSLTNKELGDLNKRLQLEQQFSQLAPKKKSKVNAGHSFVKQALAVGATVNTAIAFANSPAGKALKTSLSKK